MGALYEHAPDQAAYDGECCMHPATCNGVCRLFCVSQLMACTAVLAASKMPGGRAAGGGILHLHVVRPACLSNVQAQIYLNIAPLLHS